MVEEFCPECGCPNGDGAYQLEGIIYCCQPCADGGECICGCSEIEDGEEMVVFDMEAG